MKIKNIALAILFVSIVFSGCKKIEEAFDVTFTSDFKTNFSIVVLPDSREITGTFNASETIDPQGDSNFSQYYDLIKDIQINTVKGTITNPVPESINLVSLNVTITNANYSSTWILSNITITDGYELELNNDNGQFNTINNILLEGTEFTVSVSGETAEDAASFNLEVVVNTTITANPL